jgi:hypothetical protein
MVCWHVRALLCAASELCQLVENRGGVCELAASHDAVRRYIRQYVRQLIGVAIAACVLALLARLVVGSGNAQLVDAVLLQ